MLVSWLVSALQDSALESLVNVREASWSTLQILQIFKLKLAIANLKSAFEKVRFNHILGEKSNQESAV